MIGGSEGIVVVAALVPAGLEVEALELDCCSRMMHSGLQQVILRAPKAHSLLEVEKGHLWELVLLVGGCL